MVQILPLVRTVTLALAIVFSIIVLGLTAYITNSTTDVGFSYIFASLGLATAVITVVSLAALLIIDVIRTGAFTSMVVVELSWLSVLWILWLATAAETAQFFNLVFGGSCGYSRPAVNQACQEVQAVEAFSFLTWLLLMFYSGTVLVFAIIGSTRGHKTWTSSVRQGTFLAPREGLAPGHNNNNNFAQQAPPMQQSQYPPSGPPTQGYATPSPAPHQASPGTAYV